MKKLAAKIWFDNEPSILEENSNDQDTLSDQEKNTISVSEIDYSENEMKILAAKTWFNEPIVENSNDQNTISDRREENTISVSKINSEDETPMKIWAAKIWFNKLNRGEYLLEENSNDQDTISDQDEESTISVSEDEMTLDVADHSKSKFL